MTMLAPLPSTGSVSIGITRRQPEMLMFLVSRLCQSKSSHWIRRNETRIEHEIKGETERLM